jgi:hypothetical protein
MPDTPNSTPPPPAATPSSPAPGPGAGHVPMSEEFDRARWTLPPIVPVLIAAAAIAVVLVVVMMGTRVKSDLSGAVTKVASADQQGSTLAAVQIKLDNKFEKLLWLKGISAELETADGRKFRDRAAGAAEAERDLRAFPALQPARAGSLPEELKIPSGTSYTGFTVFAFPVDQAAFDGRKSLTVRVETYDHPAIEIKQ